MYPYWLRSTKRWWQQEVDCCPSCGSVDVRWVERDKGYVCNRLHCNAKFTSPLRSTKENRPAVRKLRDAYNAKERKSWLEFVRERDAVAAKGKMIACSRCHKGGGTLMKTSDERYVHQHCGRF